MYVDMAPNRIGRARSPLKAQLPDLTKTGIRMDRTERPDEYGRIRRTAARVRCTIILSYPIRARTANN